MDHIRDEIGEVFRGALFTITTGVLLAAALLIPAATQAARPQIVGSPNVFLRTESNGDTRIHVAIRVEDRDGIDTVSVTVGRPGVFGPIPLPNGPYANPSDSDTQDGFSRVIRTDLIPTNLRVGDYVFKVRDGTHEITATETLPSGLTPLPPIGLADFDTSTGFLTPTVSVPPAAGAKGYRLHVRNQTDLTQERIDGVPGPGLSPTPVFHVPSGVLQAGKAYRIRVEAFEEEEANESNLRGAGNFNRGYDPASGSVGLIPRANSLSLTTDEGSSISGTLRGRSDPSGSPITFQIPIGTSHGVITNFKRLLKNYFWRSSTRDNSLKFIS